MYVHDKKRLSRASVASVAAARPWRPAGVATSASAWAAAAASVAAAPRAQRPARRPRSSSSRIAATTRCEALAVDTSATRRRCAAAAAGRWGPSSSARARSCLAKSMALGERPSTQVPKAGPLNPQRLLHIVREGVLQPKWAAHAVAAAGQGDQGLAAACERHSPAALSAGESPSGWRGLERARGKP